MKVVVIGDALFVVCVEDPLYRTLGLFEEVPEVEVSRNLQCVLATCFPEVDSQEEGLRLFDETVALVLLRARKQKHGRRRKGFEPLLVELNCLLPVSGPEFDGSSYPEPEFLFLRRQGTEVDLIQFCPEPSWVLCGELLDHLGDAVSFLVNVVRIGV